MYDNILVAIDLTERAAHFVLERAGSFLKPGGTFNVLHVVEPQYVQYSFDPTFTGSLTRALEKDAIDTARQRVAELCEPAAIPTDNQIVTLGRPADEIHNVAERLGAQAVVLGSHGHHGWRVMLGSTANAVVHGAPVDVVLIRMPEDD